MFADPQVRHRSLVQYAIDRELGEVAYIRSPVKIDGRIRVHTVAPWLGQHNAEIFGRMGLSEQDIETLQAQRVV
jgi:crotonobetainyl-CoA:carnitine CoA-transferase CaiB-like acyl-CoA transferase